MKRLFIIFLSYVVTSSSCKEKGEDVDVTSIGTVPCIAQPYYLGQTGLNPRASALSTSERRIKGLVLVEYNQQGNKTWQHPSWSKYGWLGPIATDEHGNSFVAPVPVISTLDNPPSAQNTVYRVDSRTAEMKAFINLPSADTSSSSNPYGLLGLYYDCHKHLLYASTVAGSDKGHERGSIYAIDPVKGTILDELHNIDAIGLCIGGITGEKRLYLGSARTPFIYSIGINSNGGFRNDLRQEFSLDMLGPRGDDKARRIRFDKIGQMQVNGIEFNYNLTAATEKQETVYYFLYDKEAKKWVYTSH